MVALVKGQNAPLAADRIRITIEVEAPAEVSALLVTPAGRVRTDGDFAYHGRPRADGVAWVQAGPRQELAVDLTAVPADVERVLTVVSLDDRAFGAVPAPSATTGRNPPVPPDPPERGRSPAGQTPPASPPPATEQPRRPITAFRHPAARQSFRRRPR